MHTLSAVAVLVGALASKTLAQIESAAFTSYDGSEFTTPYPDYPYPSSIPPNGNAISEYADIYYLVSAIAPQVTSISPAQADQLEADLVEFEDSYTVTNPPPAILSEDPNTLLDNPSQTLGEDQINTIEELMAYPTDPDAMSSLASILSGNSASSFIMAYETAAADYQNSAYAAVAPILYRDLSLSGSPTFASQTLPAFTSATATSFSFSSSESSTLKTTGKKTHTGSSSTSSSTTSSATSSRTSSSSTTSSTAGSNSISSALAAPTAGPRVFYSAVVAAAGVLGMAML